MNVSPVGMLTEYIVAGTPLEVAGKIHRFAGVGVKLLVVVVVTSAFCWAATSSPLFLWEPGYESIGNNIFRPGFAIVCLVSIAFGSFLFWVSRWPIEDTARWLEAGIQAQQQAQQLAEQARIDAAYVPDRLVANNIIPRINASYTGTISKEMQFTITNGLVISYRKAIALPEYLDEKGNPRAEPILKAQDETVATGLAMLHFLEPIVAGDDEGPFQIELLDYIRNFGIVLQRFLKPLFEVQSPGLFDDIKNTYYANRYAVSTQLLSREQLLEAETSDRGKLVDAKDHPGSAREIITAYLTGTPFYRLFDA